MSITVCFNASLSLSQPHNPSRLISGTTSAAFPAGNLPISLSAAAAPGLSLRQHLRHDHPTLFLSFTGADGISHTSGDDDIIHISGVDGGEGIIDNSGGDGDGSIASSGGDGDGSDGINNSGGGGGDGDGSGGEGGDGNEGDDAGERNRKEALMVLGELDRSLESLPRDLAAAVEAGRIPGSVVKKFFELARNPLLAWLMQFGGFKERLLADDLFLAKIAMECGVGIFTKTAAEYERRREKFFEELEVVFADVAMAIIADFMLVYLPAPTVSLRPALGVSAGAITKFFHNCPDNAFQTALSGTSYSLAQRLGAIARNGAKLFAVGTASSLVGTTITNACINARKAVDKNSATEVENVPVLSTSVAYGVYMAVSSNLRYQLLSGVIEQRILEPLLHQQKLLLSAMCFAVRTGNTFLGSLLWVDYARLIKIQ